MNHEVKRECRSREENERARLFVGWLVVVAVRFIDMDEHEPKSRSRSWNWSSKHVPLLLLFEMGFIAKLRRKHRKKRSLEIQRVRGCMEHCACYVAAVLLLLLLVVVVVVR